MMVFISSPALSRAGDSWRKVMQETYNGCCHVSALQRLHLLFYYLKTFFKKKNP